MDNNRQQRDQQGQQSGWGQQGRQQDQWQEGGQMDTNYNMRDSGAQHPSYGEVYHGNLQQREEETNRARGHNYGQQQGGSYQGGMFQGGQQRYGQDYNPGGYGQVGNTGGGHGAWDSHGASGNDMGRGQENWNQRSQMGYGQQGRYGNQPSYGRQTGYDPYRQSSQQMGNDYSGRGQRQDDDNNWWDRTKSEVRSWFNDEGDDRNERGRYNYHEGSTGGARRMAADDRSGEQRSRGEHWGKGPRGYQRSEDRIREDVCERLAYDGQVDASEIDVKVEGTEVILTGTVHSRAEKRRAEDLVESIMGVRNVENRIRVDQDHSSSSGSWQSAGSRTEDSNRYSDSSRTGSSRSNQDRSYTGNTGEQSGIGSESGTTNEIIRNSGTTDTNL